MVAHLFQYRFGAREGLIVQWNEGWGEIAPLPGWSRETLQEAREEILSLLPDLASAKAKCPSVQFGIAAAKRPLKSVRVPLAAFGAPREGCSTLKLKAGHLTPKEAVAFVEPYVGKYRLRIDCNRKWRLEEALLFASHFSPKDFEYLEEPVQSVAELLQFSEMTQFPIALDETFRERGLVEVATLKAIVVKPMLSGVVPTGLPLVLSSAFESSLGILQIAQLAAPNSLPLGLDTFCDDLLFPPLQVEDGHLIWQRSATPIRMERLCQIA